MAYFWRRCRTCWLALVLVLVAQTACQLNLVTDFDLMKCSYGERGSLTATCVNATPGYFKNTRYKFDHLDETLLCVNCTLTSIEPNTFDLSGNQIRRMDISKSRIENLKQKAFMGLIFLEELDLSDNLIKSVYPGTFNGTKKITKINLSRNKISILSDKGFAELMHLRQLLVSHNSIEAVADTAFEGVYNLEELDLSYNRIGNISSKLSNLTSLQVLNLNNNKLTRIDRWDLYNLTKLTSLDLSNNYLTQFSLEMAPNNQLKSLNLDENRIDYFWVSLMRLYMLEALYLRKNNISEISGFPGDSLHNIRTLDLSGNKIRTIRTGMFNGLPKLGYLNCSHNAIETVMVTGVLSLSSLHVLDLSYNNISDFDYNLLLGRLPALAYLRLENNMLPCDLENQMMKDFADDNFKFVLYENYVGSIRCVDKPLNNIVAEALQDVYIESSSNAANIVIFILLAILFVAVGILGYLQYMFYKGETPSFGRVESNLQLLTPEQFLERHPPE
ncbi:hypothetical protein GWI33_001562 [Rhynchophorus ferrugineus]|uniref:Uncharacterized protein n=1 Tax=Rhynchophorus ferrugineus TaxID=354439 RepID=A0A834MGC5_RHYFE|nr:hypothetical protein GWI33_001562 [Rhynchophorus ferrugineus]